MGIRVQIIAIAASIVLNLFVLELIRRRALRVEYAIVWAIGTAALLVLSIWRDLLDIVARFIGVVYAPAVLLLVAIFFGVLALLHQTVVISRQADQIKTLAQEVSLINEKLKSAEQQTTEDRTG